MVTNCKRSVLRTKSFFFYSLYHYVSNYKATHFSCSLSLLLLLCIFPYVVTSIRFMLILLLFLCQTKKVFYTANEREQISYYVMKLFPTVVSYIIFTDFVFETVEVKRKISFYFFCNVCRKKTEKKTEWKEFNVI